MRQGAGTWRLFVAAYPPAESVAAMARALRQLSDGADPPWPAWRPTTAEQVHLTLQFIGERQEREVESVLESVARSAAGIGTIRLAPLRLLTLPERAPSRLVALETDAPAPLLELHRRLASRLARNPREAAAQRFLPHVTLCRFAHPARGFRLDRPVDIPPFGIGSIAVVRSVLHPQGAEHRTVHTVGLDA